MPLFKKKKQAEKADVQMEDINPEEVKVYPGSEDEFSEQGISGPQGTPTPDDPPPYPYPAQNPSAPAQPQIHYQQQPYYGGGPVMGQGYQTVPASYSYQDTRKAGKPTPRAKGWDYVNWMSMKEVGRDRRGDTIYAYNKHPHPVVSATGDEKYRYIALAAPFARDACVSACMGAKANEWKSQTRAPIMTAIPSRLHTPGAMTPGSRR